MRDLNLGEIFGIVKGLAGSGRLLAKTPSWSRDQMKVWQLKRLRQLVSHAYENVPFYRAHFASVGFEPGDFRTFKDFERLPFLSKDQVIQNFPQGMLARGLKLDDLIVSRSSGSSGKVLDIAYDGKAMVTYILAGLRLYRMAFNYLPWHTQLYIYTSPYPLNSLFGLYPLRFIPTLSPPSEIVEALLKHKPALIVCYPSHLKQLAQLMTSAERDSLRPRAISVNSEMSTQAERDAMEALFHCPVLDEYSSEELTRIAAQCRHKAYHLFEDINYVELLDGQGRPGAEFGTLVGTNLHNFAMPMIRYQQNDLAGLEEGACACGSHFRVLKNLQGRKNDSFSMPSGKILSSGFLLDATYEFLLEYRDATLDFCLIQKRLDLIELEIVPGTGWNAGIESAITARFKGFLEDGVSFKINPVAECEKTKTGKRNPIISHLNRSASK